ncbi:MAG: TetR/AcrR family transcriptional regulator [Devosia sp.]|nr:TetR/AcrR family transcriptional regulator [Devosia sp.]
MQPQRGNYAKRCQIIEAATGVFCRDGFIGASIDAVAAEAGVSRQTIYNQIGDKEKLFAEVVRGITERSSATMVRTLASFPDKPHDIEGELIEFATRLTRNCICDNDAVAMRKLIENEGRRYPELFETWRDYGPGKNWPAIAARFARLARDGEIELDDPDLAARQFMALIGADLPELPAPGNGPSEADVRKAATNAVRTFMRAYPPKSPRSSGGGRRQPA